MKCNNFLQLGILTALFFLSTLIFAEDDSFMFEGFDFLSEEELPEEKPPDEFIDASFDDLYNIFSNYSTLTRIQKEESWKKYEGKYVRWKGIVRYKGVGKSDKTRVGIRHKVGTNIELTFDDNKRNIIKMIDKGDKITYTGKLSKLIGRNLLLGLIEANIEEINDVSIEELKKDLENKASSLRASSIVPAQIAPGEDLSIQSDSEKSSKENIKVSFDDLYSIFGKESNLARLQKKQKWNDYKGKYIRWKGIITYKDFDEIGRKRVGISHKSGTNIELIFLNYDEDLAEMIKIGESVTYTGKLGKLIGRKLMCNVVNVEIEKIGGKPIGVLRLATLSSVLPSVTEIENKLIEDAELTMSESMAPEVTIRENLNIMKTFKGFLRISFEELDEIFGSGNRMTESQKDKLWEEYRNKYVRWSGKVVNRGLGRVSGLMMSINHMEGTDVELCFDVKHKENVLQAKPGDSVIYMGKLVNRRGYILPYRLEEAQIDKMAEVPNAENAAKD